MAECMIDIETLGTGNKAVVTSIGAVVFDLKKQQTVEQILDNGYFDVHIKVQEQIELGRKMTASTVLWWMDQSVDARIELIKNQASACGVKQVVKDFKQWCHIKEVESIWGNGNMFDNSIVRDLFEDVKASYPVHFARDFDFRTLKYLVNLKYPGWEIPYPKETVAHVGYIDAACQAYAAQRIWDKLANDHENM